MRTTLLISNDKKRAIMLRSTLDLKKTRSKPLQQTKRSESTYGTKSYSDALQRAFNKAKAQIFFNPDMNLFITLTYKGADHKPEQVLHDVKMLIKRESRRDRAKRGKLKYIYIMEYQERGSIHVHMIANDLFTLQVNKNGYRELAYWQKGFSSVLTINDFDNNFRPYLYLFKYMKKSQRIGKSFVHTSRNLKCFEEAHTTPLKLDQWKTLTMEYTYTTINDVKINFYKNYLEYDDTINPQTKGG